MKYAILADIHANLQALEAVLADSRARNCTHYACLGDVVGFGGKPKECLKIIRNMGVPCVQGNFDEYCSTSGSMDGFSPAAAKQVGWTRSQQLMRLTANGFVACRTWRIWTDLHWSTQHWTAPNDGGMSSTDWMLKRASPT